MKYMICRVDAVERRIRSSEIFPVIVNASPDEPVDEVVLRYLNECFPNYVGKHSYYAIPMTEASVVSFRPKRDYEVIVERVM
jgi:hypothetical protein